MFLKNLITVIVLTFISLSTFAETVFGPASFFSVNGNLTPTVTQIDLGSLPTGLFLIKIQNGNTGPALYAQCDDILNPELKRQCQFNNLTEQYDRDFMRAEKLFITINGNKISKTTLINKASSYLEFPVTLNKVINSLKVEMQGYPTSVVKIEVVSLLNLDLSPKALFTVNAISGKAPFKLTYNAIQSFDPMNKVLNYSFDFGVASAISNLKTANYTYLTPGEYTVKLKVQNSDGLFDELSTKIVVLPAAVVNPPANKKPVPKIVTSFPDPLNLRKLQVTNLGSIDLDGFIIKTEIDFGDGFKQLGSDITHEYLTDGTYLVRLKVWDDLNATSVIEKSVSIFGTNEFTAGAVLLGPTNYYGSLSAQAVYTENITRTLEQTQSLYKLTIKNADGLPHDQVICNQATLPLRLMCKYDNLINKSYVALNRVDWANVYVNGKKITDSTSIKKTTFVYETYLTLKQVNQLQIKLKGWPTAYIQFSLNELLIQTDHTAPVLTSNVVSDAVTNQNSVHISIQDNSSVETKVIKDGVLIATMTTKEFDIPLTEGVNNFVLKSIDQVGNATADFVLSNITLDTQTPILSSNIKTNYSVQSLGQNKEIVFQSNKPISSLTLDGVQAVKIDSTHFSYALISASEGARSINVIAIDLAGNVFNQTLTTNFTIDITPAVIAITGNLYTKQSDLALAFNITDDSNAVTEIKLDNVVIGSFVEKSFSYSVPLGVDGVKTLEVATTDDAGNVTVVSKQIVKDSTPLSLQIVSPVTGSIYSNQVVEVKLIANKALRNVLINNVPVQIGADLKSITYYTQIWTEGVFTISINAEDQFGDVTAVSVQSELKLNGAASWTYEECRAE
ncbi:MAG: PKD domain-containing protein [Pseudobdellovibrio sp.]